MTTELPLEILISWHVKSGPPHTLTPAKPWGKLGPGGETTLLLTAGVITASQDIDGGH